MIRLSFTVYFVFMVLDHFEEPVFLIKHVLKDSFLPVEGVVGGFPLLLKLEHLVHENRFCSDESG